MRLTVEGQTVEVERGATVLDAINKAGIYIPQLCKDPEMGPLGACRSCLVQIDGVKGFPASCSTLAREGMVVHTHTPEVLRIRRGVLALTAAMSPTYGHKERLDLQAELELALRRHGLEGERPFAPLPREGLDTSPPFFTLDMGACILCGRCTAACDEAQHIGAIAIVGYGYGSRIGTFIDQPIAQSICTSCGQCLAACPTGAISAKKEPPRVAKEVSTVCPYCGVGCGITLQVDKDNRIVAVQDAPENLSSRGLLCVKGRFGFEYIHHPDRATEPLVKHNGRFVKATWEEALELVAEELPKYRGRFGGYASGKFTNEEAYLFQKFVRGVMGTNNVDHCARLCHSPSVAAMTQALGSGATSNSYDDYERADCLMVVGNDPGAAHPVVAARFRRAKNLRGTKIIVVNPRYVDLCYYADLWLRPRPGTDLALFNGLARVVLEEGLWDEAFVYSRTEGFEEWRRSLEPYTVERVAEITGVPPQDLRAAARLYARPGGDNNSCLIWGMGITQHVHGTANAFALVNLALLTGQVGRPGNGVSPLRGQNNVQGCCDAGCLPNFYPGYQPVRPQTAEKFCAAWGLEAPSEVGLTATEMAEAAYAGEIRAMYIIGENPLVSEPNLRHAHAAFERLDFLVVQDLFLNETAELANVFLPGASFAEKEGTFCNSERRVQRVRQAIAPLGQSRPDWWIVCEVARRISRRLGLREGPFAFATASEVFDEMARLTPIYAGLSHARLDREGGIQWPCLTPDHPGTPIMHQDSFPRGLGRFVPVHFEKPAAELPDGDFPLFLTTGRVLYHWHGGVMTKRVEGLMASLPDLLLHLNPADAAAAGVGEGDRVRVTSRRAELVATAHLSEAMRPGEVFLPLTAYGEDSSNLLTNSVYDPISKIPEYKVSAVRVEKA